MSKFKMIKEKFYDTLVISIAVILFFSLPVVLIMIDFAPFWLTVELELRRHVKKDIKIENI